MASNPLYTLLSVICMNSDCDITTSARLRCISKDSKDCVDSYGDYMTCKQFDREYGGFVEMFERIGLWNVGSVSSKAEILKRMVGAEKRLAEINRIADDGHVYSSDEDAKRFCEFVDMWVDTEVAAVTRGFLKYFNEFLKACADIKARFFVLKRILYTIMCMFEMYISAENIDRVKRLVAEKGEPPLLLHPKFCKCLLSRCEYFEDIMCDYVTPVEEVQYTKDVGAMKVKIRSWMKMYDKMKKPPKAAGRKTSPEDKIYVGPKGGRYRIVNGCKVYIRK